MNKLAADDVAFWLASLDATSKHYHVRMLRLHLGKKWKSLLRRIEYAVAVTAYPNNHMIFVMYRHGMYSVYCSYTGEWMAAYTPEEAKDQCKSINDGISEQLFLDSVDDLPAREAFLERLVEETELDEDEEFRWL